MITQAYKNLVDNKDLVVFEGSPHIVFGINVKKDIDTQVETVHVLLKDETETHHHRFKYGNVACSIWSCNKEEFYFDPVCMVKETYYFWTPLNSLIVLTSDPLLKVVKDINKELDA